MSSAAVDAQKVAPAPSKQQAHIGPRDALSIKWRCIARSPQHRAAQPSLRRQSIPIRRHCAASPSTRLHNAALTRGCRAAGTSALRCEFHARPGSFVSTLGRCSSVENRRSDTVGRLNLLEFEFVAPGNQRPPDKLVGSHDDQHQHSQARHSSAFMSTGVAEAAVCR